jgi:hypothetical protein
MAAFIEHMKANKQVVFEVQSDAEKEWGHHINERVKETLYLSTDILLQRGRGQGKTPCIHALFRGCKGISTHLAQDCCRRLLWF